jgi:alpha-galactosidase
MNKEMNKEGLTKGEKNMSNIHESKGTLERVEDVTIAYIGGGSRNWAWGFMSDLSQEEQISGRVRLYDIDFQAAKGNAIIGNRLTEREDTIGKWKYRACESLAETLTGADFVIISILPGTFDEMDSDVHVPESYGVYQSVGDTVGPGGFMRALRTIPMFVEIAEAIKEYAPKAWVINFTNPMTLCTRTLYEVFPQIKAFGNCHEVFGTQKLLASSLYDICGIEKVKREEIKINVFGINHFTWIDRASYKGMDLFPVYKEFVEKYYDSGFEDGKSGNWLNDFFTSAQRVKFDLFKRYSLIAAAGDRHLAEFCPGLWYLSNPEKVSEWKFGLTPVSFRKQQQKELFEKAQALISGKEKFEIKETGEEGVSQMKAILGLKDLVTNVNLPNKGQIKNLPLGVVVETNALFQKDSVSPIYAGELPLPILSLIYPHILNQEMTLEAALNVDKILAFKAFINDPLMRLPLDKANIIFEEMLENTKAYHLFCE